MTVKTEKEWEEINETVKVGRIQRTKQINIYE